MSELRDLYQEVILDHNKRPRNFGTLADATRRADGDNPLCGDRIHLEIRLAGERLEDIAFQGRGCAISTASASMMTEALKGRTVTEARALFRAFHQMLTGTQASGEPIELGKLEAFSGVKEYPMRVKCATLAWHTLSAALKGGGSVTSEGDGGER